MTLDLYLLWAVTKVVTVPEYRFRLSLQLISEIVEYGGGAQIATPTITFGKGSQIKCPTPDL